MTSNCAGSHWVVNDFEVQISGVAWDLAAGSWWYGSSASMPPLLGRRSP